MGVDIAALMGLMTGGGNLMGQMGNLQAQKMGMANSLWDAFRYFQRNSDPTINDINQYNVNRFNANPYGPYGDVEGSFGNMWGARADGSPVQFGDMAAAQTNYMMNNNPANAALLQLQSAANMQRPSTPSAVDMMSGDAYRAGMQPFQQSSMPKPMAPMNSPTMPSTVMQGVAAPQAPNPTISDPTPGPGTQIRQNINDIRSGQSPSGFPGMGGLGGMAGGQGSGQRPGMQFLMRGIQNHGGMPALIGAMRGPGSAMDNIGDFLRGNQQHGTPQQTGSNPMDAFWAMKGQRGPQGMRSYAVGTPYVQRSGPAMLHQGEAVIPRQMNPYGGAQTQGNMAQGPQRMVPTIPRPGQQTGGVKAPVPPPPQMMTGRTPQPQPPAPVDPRSRLPQPVQQPGGGAGHSAGMGSGGVGSQGVGQGMGGQTPVPPVANPSINQGRVDLVNGLLQNPESMSQQWQNTANQQFADAYDKNYGDLQRQLQERMGASGLGDSGILQDQMFRGDLARSSDLANQRTNIAQNAALTNFNDRQQVANLALQHQLGIGNMSLAQNQFQNQMFNQDRDYQTQLAGLMMNLGMQGQNQQSNLLGQLGGLIGSGTGYNNNLLGTIMQQAMQRYADPNVSAVQQYSYAPNPYLDYLSAQNSGGGGTDMSGLWGALGMGAGAYAGSASGSAALTNLLGLG